MWVIFFIDTDIEFHQIRIAAGHPASSSSSCPLNGGKCVTGLPMCLTSSTIASWPPGSPPLCDFARRSVRKMRVREEPIDATQQNSRRSVASCPCQIDGDLGPLSINRQASSMHNHQAIITRSCSWSSSKAPPSVQNHPSPPRIALSRTHNHLAHK